MIHFQVYLATTKYWNAINQDESGAIDDARTELLLTLSSAPALLNERRKWDDGIYSVVESVNTNLDYIIPRIYGIRIRLVWRKNGYRYEARHRLRVNHPKLKEFLLDIREVILAKELIS